MGSSLESLVRQLQDSGLVAAETLEGVLAAPTAPNSVESLLARLVQRNKLTKFQAASIAAGRAKSLVLGGYTILDRIGAGGMGQVFKALHRRMDRVVAIKTLPAAAMKDSAAVARFEREVRAAAKLRHPNIVAADDADQAGGVHFLVMEFVDGCDLSAVAKKSGPLPLDDAANYMLQAARGLEFAHAQGVVHRDIKPANLLLDKQGVVKILDLGLARIDAGAASAPQAELTGTGAIMGTVDYMAPEQSLDTRSADAKADVYSLGCTWYRLVTGENPFRGETVVQKILAHREQPVPSPAAIRPEMPPQQVALCRRMMAKHPTDRPTMAELVKELEAAAGPSGERIGSSVVIDVQRTTVVEAGARGAKPAAGRVAASTKARSRIRALSLGIGSAMLSAAVALWFWNQDPNGEPGSRVAAADGDKSQSGGRVSFSVQPTSTPLSPTLSPTPSPSASPAATPVPTAAAPRDFALAFNGATSRVDIPLEAADYSAMTIEGWVRFKSRPNQVAHIISANLGTRRASLYWQRSMFADDDRKLASSAVFDGEGRTTHSVDVVDIDRWLHVAAVWDGGLRIFLDGRLQGQGFLKFQTVAATPPQIALGTDLFGKNFLHGSLDEVRISSVALYQSDFSPDRRLTKNTATIGLYHFDEGQGEVLHDASGYGRDGKITDGIWTSGLEAR